MPALIFQSTTRDATALPGDEVAFFVAGEALLDYWGRGLRARSACHETKSKQLEEPLPVVTLNMEQVLQIARTAYEQNERPNFNGVDLSGLNLSFTHLVRADLAGANLTEVDMSGADLTFADFRQANLSEAILIRANFSGADLREAYLGGVDLFRADLIWTDLRGTDLSDADLQEANLRAAKYDKHTKWPEDFDLLHAEAIRVD